MPNTATRNPFIQQYDSTRGLFVNRTTRRASTTTNEPQVIMAPLSVGTEEIGDAGDIIHTGSIRTGGNSNIGGSIVAAGNITAFYSDERLKVHVGEIEDPLTKIGKLTAFYYHANKTAEALGYDPSIREIGLSAQEVQAIMPEAVAPAPADPNYLTIRYERLIPLLVEAIKELQAEVRHLKTQAGE